MGGMRIPPSVHVVLSPSRIAGVGIGIVAAATLALTVALPMHPLLQAVTVAAVVASAVWSFEVDALQRSRFAVTEIRVAPDLMLVACMGDGHLVAGHVCAATYVGARLTTIVWRPDGRRWSRTILVLPDMLPAEDFRRLRVMLRYARSAEVQVAPASQA
jgi:toxin CptA